MKHTLPALAAALLVTLPIAGSANLAMAPTGAAAPGGTPQTVFLTDTGLTSWEKPADWSDTNQVECIGGGGGVVTPGTGTSGASSGGGGGGYSSASNITGLPSVIPIKIGVSRAPVTGGSVQLNGTDGEASWFNGANAAAATVSADGGKGGQSRIDGGTPAVGAGGAGINGATKFTGGAGGAGVHGGGGGGGAAGFRGGGSPGGTADYSGGGGGGNGGRSIDTPGGSSTAGGAGSSGPGGTGGTSQNGTAGGAGGVSVPSGGPGGAGSQGSGGGGGGTVSVSGAGAKGGDGVEWSLSPTRGSGGGGGASAGYAGATVAGPSGNGGLYGGGAAGGSASSDASGIGGTSGQGVCRVTWTPGGAAPPCAEATAFLGRAGTLDATHTSAYTTMICGMVTDGTWAKMDALYMLATQNTTAAHLNLKSGTLANPLTVQGAPTFLADNGYLGVSSPTADYLNTAYNVLAPTAGLFSQNSAHLGAWSLTNVQSSGSIIGNQINDQNAIFPRYTADGKAYFRVNADSAVSTSLATANAVGHYVANRPNTTTIEGWKEGSLISTNSSASSVVQTSQPLILLASGGSAGGSPHRIAAAHFGGTLLSGDITALRARLCAYLEAVNPGSCPAGGGGGTSPCAEAQQFRDRTTGLDATHLTAYDTMICGLATAGADEVWSKLDALYVYATQDTPAVARNLNLKSASYPITAYGPPVFSANNGYTGVNASTAVYLDTGFNPATAGGAFAQNSAHLMVWDLTATTQDYNVIGHSDGVVTSTITPFTAGNDYCFITNNASQFIASATVTTALGSYICTRTAASGTNAEILYRNGVFSAGAAHTSQALLSRNIWVTNSNSLTGQGSSHQIAAASIGGGLTGAQAAALHSRICTYLNTIHGAGTCTP